jgi:acid phosphatase (class A)
MSASAQSIHPLETISQHKKNALQSSELNSARASMDMIQFPWKEYSKSALGNSLMRTYYINAEDESKLSSFVQMPANSSDQTKVDLQYGG